MQIMIVEDEFITCEYFSQHIQKQLGYEAATAHSKKEALDLVGKVKPDVIFMDIAMETSTAGIEACQEIKADHPEIRIYLVSAYTEENFKSSLITCKHNGYIDKTQFTDVVADYL